jgi:lipoprotein-releasing system permease protein
MLGTAALIVTLAILSGFEKTLTSNVLGYTSNVEISSYGNHPLPDFPGTSRYLQKKVPSIVALTPFAEHEAILRSPRGVVGVMLRGIPATDTSVMAMKRIQSGHSLAQAATDTIDPIVISAGLAKTLHTSVGKNLAAIRFNERLRSREDILANLHLFRIVGIYATGMSQYDDMIAYTSLPAAQKFVGFSMTQVSGYDIRTPTLESSAPVADSINHILHYPYVARSVYDVYPTIFAWIDLQKKPIPIILGLIILVAAFNMISTLLLIVIEKTRSIGILKSLGSSTRGIARIFVTQGMAIAIVGTLGGDLLGFILCILEAQFHFFKLRSDIYFMSSVPVSIEWQHYALVSVISVVLALSATFIPARIAAKMQPLAALQFA